MSVFLLQVVMSLQLRRQYYQVSRTSSLSTSNETHKIWNIEILTLTNPTSLVFSDFKDTILRELKFNADLESVMESAAWRTWKHSKTRQNIIVPTTCILDSEVFSSLPGMFPSLLRLARGSRDKEDWTISGKYY